MSNRTGACAKCAAELPMANLYTLPCRLTICPKCLAANGAWESTHQVRAAPPAEPAFAVVDLPPSSVVTRPELRRTG